MGHIAAWVGPPTWKAGLDNVGTQQPCIFIYSALLPGITNVTDRAWHFGFYPWFIRAFEQRRPDASEIEFRDWLRRADCLATLISARHAIVRGDDGRDNGRHGSAFPGRLTLLPAARSLSSGDGGSAISLSTYTEPSDENELRYFKNSLGGLGQYYLGVLRDEYHALDGNRRSGVRYTNEIGFPLATAFGHGLDEAAFMDAVAGDRITAAVLDRLSMFCPCALSEQRETARAFLADMFLARDPRWIAGGQNRRATLGLALDLLAEARGAQGDDAAAAFLAACYTSALPTGAPWQPSAHLADIRTCWGLYLRNEMLSLAWEAIFKAALEAIDGIRGIPSIRAAASRCVDHPHFAEALGTLGYATFDGAVESEASSLPPLTELCHPRHELALWRELPEVEGAESVAAALRMLAGLIARHGRPTRCYAPFRLPNGALADYPLTLDTLGRAAVGPWRGLGARDWAHALVASALSAHQRVAIRKLGQSGDDTLMFRIGEDGLFVERRMEEVVETQPRLTQAFQILRDLGLTVPSGPGLLAQPTARGLAALEEIRGV